MIAVLRRRDFALLWTAGLISLLGDSALSVALPFYIYQRTGSPAAVGAMVVAEALPEVLFGSVAGVLVDRWDRRRTMVVGGLLRAVLLLLLLPLPLAHTDAWLWVLYPVAFAHATVGQVFYPARATLLSRLVAEKELPAANALQHVNAEVIRLVGPPLGGALLAAYGFASVIAVDAATFVVSAAVVALIRGAADVPRGRLDTGGGSTGSRRRAAAVWREWLDGLRQVRRDHVVAALFGVYGLVAIGNGVWGVLWVVWVRDVLLGGPTELGWMLTARGVGGLVGGVLAGFVVASVRPGAAIACGLGLSALLLVVVLHAASFPLALGLLAVVGVPSVVWAVAHQTLLQRQAADRYRGRVFGALGTSAALLGLGGTGLASALATPVGTVPLLDLACALYLLAGLAALVLLDGATKTRAAER